MRNYETYFEIELENQEKNITTNRLAIEEENNLVKCAFRDLIEEISLDKVKAIYLKVFGPMDSFGSNCGEIKEKIY